jgi:hypothetical protein
MSIFDSFRSWAGSRGGDAERSGGRSGAVGKRTLVEAELGRGRRRDAGRDGRGDGQDARDDVIDVPGHSPIPIRALERFLHDPMALADLPPVVLGAIATHFRAPQTLLFGPLPMLVHWILERLRPAPATRPGAPATTTTTPTTPSPTPASSETGDEDDESRHDLLARISAERRRLLPTVEAEHTPDGRLRAQQAMIDALAPLLDRAATFPADTRWEHPDRGVVDDVLAAVQLRGAMHAHSRLGDQNAETEARKQAGLPEGQWCGAFAFTHASSAGLDRDLAGDTLSTGPGQGLDNLFTYKDARRWIWTGADWRGTREYHEERGSVRRFSLVPASPDPASLDIRPGDIVLKDNARGTFADHITTCATYDASTGRLTTVGGNEGSGTLNKAGVGEGTVDIGANPAAQTVAEGGRKPTRVFAVGRWSLVDFEDHVFSTSRTRPTQPPR